MRQLLTVLLLLTLSVSWSQTVTYDTIVKVTEIEEGKFDTTYYVKQHVQITEKHIVFDTIRGNKWAFDFFFGTSLANSKTKYLEPNLTYKSERTFNQYIGGSVYYNFPKHWGIRLGAKFNHHNINVEYQKETKYLEEFYEQITDTIDTYYYINGSITTYVNVVETRTITRSEERTKYSEVNYNWGLYFIKVPIQVSYKVELKKWSLMALLGTSLNFQLYRFKGNIEQARAHHTSFYPSGILSLQAHYFLGNSTTLFVEPIFEKSFQNSQNNLFPSNQLSIGLGLKQFF